MKRARPTVPTFWSLLYTDLRSSRSRCTIIREVRLQNNLCFGFWNRHLTYWVLDNADVQKHSYRTWFLELFMHRHVGNAANLRLKKATEPHEEANMEELSGGPVVL